MVGFASGVAQGFGQGQQLSQNRRAQALQASGQQSQRQLELAKFKLLGERFEVEQKREMRANAETGFRAFAGALNEGVTSGAIDPDNLPPQIQTRLNMLENIFAAAGFPAGELQARLGAQLATAATPAQQARTEAQAGVAGAEAQAAALGLTGDAQRQAVLQQLGLGQEAGDAFFRALNELESLRAEVQAGTREAGDERIKRVQDRLNSLTEGEAGFSLVVDENGKLRGVTFGGDQPALFPALTAGNQLTQLQRRNALAGNVELVDSILEMGAEDPTLFGAVGTVRRAAQTAAGVTADLGAVVERATGININRAAEEALSLVTGTPVEEDMAGFFDPNLSQVQLLENTLAFELARLRLQRSGDDLRAIKSAFDTAKKDVKLTGVTTSADVEQRLLNVRQQFVDELQILDEALRGQGVPPAEIAQPPSAGATVPGVERAQEVTDDLIDDLDRRLNELLGLN